MSISDDSLKSRCDDVFGDSLDQEERAFISAALGTLEKRHPQLLEHLSSTTEPAGHAGFLRYLAGEK